MTELEFAKRMHIDLNRSDSEILEELSRYCREFYGSCAPSYNGNEAYDFQFSKGRVALNMMHGGNKILSIREFLSEVRNQEGVNYQFCLW